VPVLTATIDTSVFLSLQSGDLLPAVNVLFNRILVPSKVRQELKDGGERNEAALRAIDEFAIFEPCDDYNRELVQHLLQTRDHLRIGRDEGEAEAVIQAAQGAVEVVLTDDAQGRRWARDHARECHGTIWICYELRRAGFLTELRPPYLKMLRSGRRHPLDQINAYLQEFREQPISAEELNSHDGA
jgi:predicted nucleic acid-binding protein